MIKITIKQRSIIEEKVDAIVNPSNSYGLMNGGVGAAIKAVGGNIIEVDAMRNSPIRIGESLVTTGGMLFAGHIIHSPTMQLPSEKATEENIRKAVRSSLKAADDNRFSRIAMPGMGTGTGEFEPIDAAKIIIEEINGFKARNLKEVILVDISETMVNAFKDAMKIKN